ncbi:hypothetical protein LUU34_00001300 [Aix galericulata]|nr:hypothetical protein LUU34_00001300 [Aix galericulata]
MAAKQQSKSWILFMILMKKLKLNTTF